MHRCWFCRRVFRTWGKLVSHHRSHARRTDWRQVLSHEESD